VDSIAVQLLRGRILEELGARKPKLRWDQEAKKNGSEITF
jgi:hypothetical protein